MRVGIIGLGIMGAPMARNLLRAGHPLTVHTRTRARAAGLLADGAAWADSPAALAAAVDAVVTMLPDTPDVEAVVAGPDGVLAGARPGLLAIDMSTIDPAPARGSIPRQSSRQWEAEPRPPGCSRSRHPACSDGTSRRASWCASSRRTSAWRSRARNGSASRCR